MSKEIPIRCKGNRYVAYRVLKDFQGNLKEMSKKNFDKFRRIILKHGWIAPVFVWNDNYILDGHGRLKVLDALIKDGYTIGDIPVVDIEAKTKKEAAEILLAINSHYQTITDEGLYEFLNEMKLDFDLLKDCDLPEIDVEKFELNFLKDKNEMEDEVPEIKEGEPHTKRNDIYELGRHRVMCGDATSKEDMEKLMDGVKAAMVFTDPPYGVSYADKNKFLNTIARGNRIQTEIKNDNLSVDELGETILCPAFCNIYTYLKYDGAYYITAPQGGALLMTVMMMVVKSGLKLKHMLIWVKNNHVLGRTDYNYKHEPILYGWKDKHKFYGKGEHTFSTWMIDKPLKSDLHPTMKPVELVVNALLNSSQNEDIILDPFLGSGTTLIAAEKTNRICYGMEIDPHYCDIIITRWAKYTGINKVKKNGKKITWNR